MNRVLVVEFMLAPINFDIMKFLLLIVFIFVVVFVSCESQDKDYLLIDYAEALLNRNPDSAYLLLNNILEPEKYCDKQFARWCMLYSEAADRKHQDMPYVSQLQRAQLWFGKYGNKKEQALVGLYLGRSYMEDRELKKSMEAYLEALNIAKENKEFNIAGYICSYIADIYEYKDMPVNARDKFSEAANYFNRVNNKRSYALALRDVGRTWAFVDSSCLALKYMKKADSIVITTYDLESMASVANGLGNIYGMMGEIDESENCLLRSLELDTLETASSYLALSDLHLNNENLERAYYYLEKASVETKNINTPANIVYMHYQIDKAANNIPQALSYLEQYQIMLDSVYNLQNDVNLLDIEKRYNHVKMLKENDELRINLLLNIVLLAILAVFILIVFIFYQQKTKSKNFKIYEQQKVLNCNEIKLLQLEAELNKKQKTIYLQNSLEDNVVILNQIKKEIEQMRDEVTYLRNEKFYSSPIVKKVIKLSEKVVAGATQSPLTSKDWKKIVDIVDQTYVSLNSILQKNELGFTPSELEYCYLSFFQLDIFAESILLNINPESVGKRRLRVRQRLGLIGEETTLYRFL